MQQGFDASYSGVELDDTWRVLYGEGVYFNGWKEINILMRLWFSVLYRNCMIYVYIHSCGMGLLILFFITPRIALCLIVTELIY